MKKVTSREYKVMLRPNRFGGSSRELARASARFWQDFSDAMADIVRGVDGTLEKIGRRRSITFLDTSNHLLNKSGYIFRERRDAGDGGREVTLKFRHEDRHVTQSRDMTARRARKAETKFEEDIKPPFVSLYSYSTTVAVSERWAGKTLDDVRRLFPDLRARVDNFSGDEVLRPVRNFTARELVLDGGSLKIGKSPKVTAECGLIVWYDSSKRDAVPVAVEFSFRYRDKREQYSGAATRRAYEVFKRIPKALKAWVDPHSRTKTRLVYG